MSGRRNAYSRNSYGKRRIQPRIRFRLRNLILIFVVCIVVGLIYYMIKVNL
ncbi:MAG: hypothetical protein ACI4JQ_00405 [Ruminococcus sp.]